MKGSQIVLDVTNTPSNTKKSRSHTVPKIKLFTHKCLEVSGMSKHRTGEGAVSMCWKNKEEEEEINILTRVWCFCHCQWEPALREVHCRVIGLRGECRLFPLKAKDLCELVLVDFSPVKKENNILLCRNLQKGKVSGWFLETTRHFFYPLTLLLWKRWNFTFSLSSIFCDFYSFFTLTCLCSLYECFVQGVIKCSDCHLFFRTSKGQAVPLQLRLRATLCAL